MNEEQFNLMRMDLNNINRNIITLINEMRELNGKPQGRKPAPKEE